MVYLRKLEIVAIRSQADLWWFYYIATGPHCRALDEVGVFPETWLSGLLADAEDQIEARDHLVQAASAFAQQYTEEGK